VLLKRPLASNGDGIRFGAGEAAGGQETGKEVEGSIIGAAWVDGPRTREQHAVRHNLTVIKY